MTPTAPEQPGRRWGTVDDASRMISVHPLTIRKWLSQGKIKGTKIAGCVRVDLQALEAQLEGEKIGKG
jgi:excisionase family DNA binding protein